MGFVGNYAPRGLAPQIDDMPVIPKKPVPPSAQVLSAIFLLFFYDRCAAVTVSFCIIL